MIRPTYENVNYARLNELVRFPHHMRKRRAVARALTGKYTGEVLRALRAKKGVGRPLQDIVYDGIRYMDPDSAARHRVRLRKAISR
jgi:hypothetical protein